MAGAAAAHQLFPTKLNESLKKNATNSPNTAVTKIRCTRFQLTVYVLYSLRDNSVNGNNIYCCLDKDANNKRPRKTDLRTAMEQVS